MPSQASARPTPFETLYETHFAFVWRNLRRVGVSEAHLDDATQDVFIIVHRRLGEFAERSSVRAWLFGILVRVASDHRRTLRRKSPHTTQDVPDFAALEPVVRDESPGPDEKLLQREAVALLHRLLEELDDARRAVFVLVELEQLSMPEAVEALGINLNTGYARLRAARRIFEKALARTRAHDIRRLG